MNQNINKMVKLAMLSALGVLFMAIIHVPMFSSFLIYDPGDIPALIAAFLYGPVAGFIVVTIISLIQMIAFDTNGIVGFMMHVIASGAMVIVAGLIYRKAHTFKGAILSLICGGLTMTALMVPLNLIIDTWYFGYPLPAVIALLGPAIIPFNLVKACINSVVTVLVYKSVGKVLRIEPKKLIKD